MSGRALALTTINGSDNRCLQTLAAGASRHALPFYVAGDTKTPAGFSLEGVTYLSLEEQERQFPAFCALLPRKHYGRKNVAYLAAMRDGAEEIQETDDDNYPRAGFWGDPLSGQETMEEVAGPEGEGWVNVYGVFAKQRIWPRGLPLEMVHHSAPRVVGQRAAGKALVLQGLADENPDVDAVYRMVADLPMSFEQRPAVIVAPGAWCPFNSQNTIFRRRAFPLLYLPSFCSFRMTDIWRSFVAQRCLWELGEGVVFHAATVYQERNEHRLLKDFEDEIPGYLHNERIRLLLEGVKVDGGDLAGSVVRCYEALVGAGIVGEGELPLVRAWVRQVEIAAGTSVP